MVTAGTLETCIGIDVGGTKMLAALVAADGRVLARYETPSRAGSYLEDAVRIGGHVLEAARRLGTEPIGIGFGTTGFVDHATGRLRRSLAFGLHDVDVKGYLEANLGLTTIVDNDIHAAALGELIFGAGRGFDDFLYVNAGTGVAVGIVLGGRLHRGASNVAGEAGHMSIDPSGVACRCGLHGCLEAIVVGTRSGSEAHAPLVEDASRILPGAPLPPPDAPFVYLALGIVNLVNLLNPAAVVLAGGMYTNEPAAAAWTEAAVRAAALPAASEALRHVGVSSAGATAGVIGAAALVLESAGNVQGRRHA